MDCMQQDYIPEYVCLGSVPAGSVVMLSDDDSPYLVTNNKRIKQQVSGGTVDTIGIVACDTGSMFWFSDRRDVIPAEYATLLYRLAGKGKPKHD